MIKEVIVVEGKNDAAKLSRYFDAETIITGGLSIDDQTIELIREAAKKRGVILLLDPDRPGEIIRSKINAAIPGLKNAFIFKKDARTKRKVGVEHASKEVLKEALENLVTYGKIEEGLTSKDMIELGLIGSKERRMIVSSHYHLGECSAKTLRKRLAMLGVKRAELERILDGYDS